MRTYYLFYDIVILLRFYVNIVLRVVRGELVTKVSLFEIFILLEYFLRWQRARNYQLRNNKQSYSKDKIKWNY